MMNLPGSGEWIVIAFVGLLVFGRRLPEVARSLGRSILEFRRALRDDDQPARPRRDDRGRTSSPATTADGGNAE